MNRASSNPFPRFAPFQRLQWTTQSMRCVGTWDGQQRCNSFLSRLTKGWWGRSRLLFPLGRQGDEHSLHSLVPLGLWALFVSLPSNLSPPEFISTTTYFGYFIFIIGKRTSGFVLLHKPWPNRPQNESGPTNSQWSILPKAVQKSVLNRGLVYLGYQKRKVMGGVIYSIFHKQWKGKLKITWEFVFNVHMLDACMGATNTRHKLYNQERNFHLYTYICTIYYTHMPMYYIYASIIYTHILHFNCFEKQELLIWLLCHFVTPCSHFYHI